VWPSSATAQLHKCVNNGAVTYQGTPCPAGEAGRQPSVDELNARRRKNLAQSAEVRPKPAPATGGSVLPRPESPPAGKLAAAPPAAPSPRFKCDGRRYCAQMTSCAEATYFLAHCPGVQMDGDGDGVPCESQWCVN
jgi:hypothetical protein